MGSSAPFWQSFVYEQLEGLCSFCGSLHLRGHCNLRPQDASSSSSTALPCYGSWLVAVRQRVSSVGSQPGLRKKPAAPVAPVAAGSDPPAAAVAGQSQEGWSVPSRSGRRRPSKGGKELLSQSSHGGVGGSDGSPREDAVSVPALLLRAGSSNSGQSQKASVVSKSEVSRLKQSVISKNPFAPLSSGSGGVGLVEPKEAFSGPLKRPRPEGGLAPRSSPNSGVRKGKGKEIPSKGNALKFNSADRLAQSLGCQDVDQLNHLDKEAGSSLEGAEGFIFGHAPVSMSLDQSSCLADHRSDVDGQQSCLPLSSDGGTLSVECCTDSVMIEDQGGIPDPSGL